MKLELPEEIVERIQLARAKTFECEFELAEILTKQVGEWVCSKVSKTLHGNTYQVPNNPPRIWKK